MHCDIWKNRGKEDLPTVDQWKTVLRDLRRWLGPVHVVLTGGEALLMPFATDLVAYGSSIGLLIEHLTHGYWLDQSRIERLALANPWRVTISLDGIGEVHDAVRRRDQFFDIVVTSIGTLKRVRAEKRFKYSIRLKTVIMEQNLDSVCEVARFARDGGLEAYYQPIVQNYNTVEDARWFEHNPTWPKDPTKAVAVVEQLIAMKRDGYPIANEVHDLEVMIPYFRDPNAMCVATRAHAARKPLLRRPDHSPDPIERRCWDLQSHPSHRKYPDDKYPADLGEPAALTGSPTVAWTSACRKLSGRIWDSLPVNRSPLDTALSYYVSFHLGAGSRRVSMNAWPRRYLSDRSIELAGSGTCCTSLPWMPRGNSALWRSSFFCSRTSSGSMPRASGRYSFPVATRLM